ncbi:LPXTG cell wall anchor domain-containing protein, partial [Enterococcus casseliflavus]|nr:LPXTG cell wall anchor domain-containing protein [Enterococcus casseliflavus]
ADADSDSDSDADADSDSDADADSDSGSGNKKPGSKLPQTGSSSIAASVVGGLASVGAGFGLWNRKKKKKK